jgi:hypothetical protein
MGPAASHQPSHSVKYAALSTVALLGPRKPDTMHAAAYLASSSLAANGFSHSTWRPACTKVPRQQLGVAVCAAGLAGGARHPRHQRVAALRGGHRQATTGPAASESTGRFWLVKRTAYSPWLVSSGCRLCSRREGATKAMPCSGGAAAAWPAVPCTDGQQRHTRSQSCGEAGSRSGAPAVLPAAEAWAPTHLQRAQGPVAMQPVGQPNVDSIQGGVS